MLQKSPIRRLLSGSSSLQSQDLDFIMELAHPSPAGFRAVASKFDGRTESGGGFIYDWNTRLGRYLEIVAGAAKKALEALYDSWNVIPNCKFASDLECVRERDARHENCTDEVRLFSQQLGDVAAYLSKSKKELRTISDQLRAFALEYAAHTILLLSGAVEVHNSDGFIAAFRSLIEAIIVYSVRAGSCNEAQQFVRQSKGRVSWRNSKNIGKIRRIFPECREWYKEAGAYPHAGIASLEPRLLVVDERQTWYTFLSPEWDEVERRCWLERADEVIGWIRQQCTVS